MKKKAGSFKEWVVWQLRRLSYRWPARSAAFRRAAASRTDYRNNPGETVTKRVRNFYFCEKCKRVFSRKGVTADHKLPVIDPKKGFENFDVYIRRLFCEAFGFQIICNHCHDKKTKSETQVRKMYRRLRKAV